MTGWRLLSDIAEGLTLSLEKPLDFHAKTILFLDILKYLKTGWNTK